MSAYVVSDTTINKVLYTIDRAEGAASMLQVMANSELCVLGTGTSALRMLGPVLRDLNVRSVQARYADADEAGMLPEAPYQYRCEPCSTIAGFKALRCFLYQASEGTCSEDPAFLFLHDTVWRFLSAAIIAELPEYAAADWG